MVYIFVCVVWARGARRADVYKIHVLYVGRHILIKFIAGWKSGGGAAPIFWDLSLNALSQR